MKSAQEDLRKWEEVKPCEWPILKPRQKISNDAHIYLDGVCAFDIETYTFDIGGGNYQAAMYMWQFQCGLECTYIGRTWDEFLTFVNVFGRYLDFDNRIVVYVHNLSYEYQFIKNLLPINSVFARDCRKIVRVDTPLLEFRCSYFHSNMSLSAYTKKFNVKHVKLDEKIDYQQEYWFDTPLDEHHLMYGAYDVMGLVEAIITEMESDGDDLYTIPLTSTGYVRREAKNAMRGVGKYYKEDLKPAYAIYRLSRQAFRGGDTHANRYYAGKILREVKSLDFSSSYPAWMCMDEYPVGAWESRERDVDSLLRCLRHCRPFLARVVLRNVQLRDDEWGIPYLSFSKCRNVSRYELDNGRILKAALLETTITDVDFKIIMEEYRWEDMDVLDLYSSHYKELPESYRALIRKYYVDKTCLKGVEGQELYYMKQKNRINSFYGMMAQNPVMQEYELLREEMLLEQVEMDEHLLYSDAKVWIPYVWGVWCTAHARFHLHEAVRICGEGFVYADTDSVKYVGDVDFSDYNAHMREKAEKSGCFAEDRHGMRHYMGVLEEDCTYQRFVTWGAKKYAYEQEGKLGITVAGVGKKEGAEELARKGGLDVFKPGMVFEGAAGGLEAIYNDQLEPVIYTRKDGVEISLSSNLALVPSTYTLGLSDDYDDLLRHYNIDSPKNLLYNDIKNNII